MSLSSANRELDSEGSEGEGRNPRNKGRLYAEVVCSSLPMQRPVARNPQGNAAAATRVAPREPKQFTASQMRQAVAETRELNQ